VKGKATERTRCISERSLQNLVPYKKGQTGNPGGKTKQFAQCQRLCREASPEAARRLIQLIHSEDERVALMAADKVYERAWGKPKEYDPNAEQVQREPTFDPSLYSSAELEQLHAAVLLMARRQGLLPPGEGEEASEGVEKSRPAE
jgi:hypothetical protein